MLIPHSHGESIAFVGRLGSYKITRIRSVRMLISVNMIVYINDSFNVQMS